MKDTPLCLTCHRPKLCTRRVRSNPSSSTITPSSPTRSPKFVSALLSGAHVLRSRQSGAARDTCATYSVDEVDIWCTTSRLTVVVSMFLSPSLPWASENSRLGFEARVVLRSALLWLSRGIFLLQVVIVTG